MKNELYRKIIRAASESVDGETPSLLTLTEEVNCYIIWFSAYSVTTRALKVFTHLGTRDQAIEAAVTWDTKALLEMEDDQPAKKHGPINVGCDLPAQARAVL